MHVGLLTACARTEQRVSLRACCYGGGLPREGSLERQGVASITRGRREASGQRSGGPRWIGRRSPSPRRHRRSGDDREGSLEHRGVGVPSSVEAWPPSPTGIISVFCGAMREVHPPVFTQSPARGGRAAVGDRGADLAGGGGGVGGLVERGAGEGAEANGALLRSHSQRGGA